MRSKSRSPKVTVDEDGYEDRKTSSAIEEVAEGEVEKEDGDVVAQPGELLPVPGRSQTTGVGDITYLILTYGMATKVRRLPVIPTVITSVLFMANPSLPSVISWG